MRKKYDYDAIVKDYRSGMTAKELWKKYDVVGLTGVYQILYQSGVRHVGRRGRPPLDRDRIAALRDAGLSNKEIAEEMSCNKGTICRILGELAAQGR